VFASTFTLLYVAHLIADYAAQTDHQAAHKADSGWSGWSANLAHVATHVVSTAVVLTLGALVLHHGPGLAAACVAMTWIAGTHAVIDRRWPIRWLMAHTGQRGYYEHGDGAAQVDQVAHVTVLLAAALLLAR